MEFLVVSECAGLDDPCHKQRVHDDGERGEEVERQQPFEVVVIPDLDAPQLIGHKGFDHAVADTPALIFLSRTVVVSPRARQRRSRGCRRRRPLLCAGVGDSPQLVHVVDAGGYPRHATTHDYARGDDGRRAL